VEHYKFYLTAGKIEYTIRFSRMAWDDSDVESLKFLKVYLDQIKTSHDYRYIKRYNPGIERLLR